MPSTAVDIVESLLKRKSFQEKRGRKFKVRLPRPLPPIPVERRYWKDIKNLFKKTLIQKTDLLLIEQLDSILTEGRRDLGITVVTNDAFADRLTKIIQGVLIDYGLDLDRFKRFITLRGNETSDWVNKEIKKSANAIAVNPFIVDRTLEETLRSFVDINTSYLQRYGDEYANRIGEIVLNGTRQGLLTEEVASQIRKQYDWLTENKAKILARDQIGKLNGQLEMTRYGNLGVQRYIWRTALDERVRPEHEAMEGQVYEWTGKNASPIGPPGFPINCRCVAEPVFEDIVLEPDELEDLDIGQFED